MTDVDDGRAHDAGNLSPAATAKAWAAAAVWLAGVVASVYLVVQSLVLAFFALVFADYNGTGFAWWMVGDVARSTLPLLGFGALGYAGLRFWPRGRRRGWGLAAIGLQSAAAVYLYADPEGFLIFM